MEWSRIVGDGQAPVSVRSAGMPVFDTVKDSDIIETMHSACFVAQRGQEEAEALHSGSSISIGIQHMAVSVSDDIGIQVVAFSESYDSLKVSLIVLCMFFSLGVSLFTYFSMSG